MQQRHANSVHAPGRCLVDSGKWMADGKTLVLHAHDFLSRLQKFARNTNSKIQDPRDPEDFLNPRTWIEASRAQRLDSRNFLKALKLEY